jgi:hypothetical protein
VTKIEDKPIGWLGWLWRAALAVVVLIGVAGTVEATVAAATHQGVYPEQSLGLGYGPSGVKEPGWQGIARVAPGYSAAVAGLQVGDSVRIDGFLGQVIVWRPGERVSMTVARGGRRFPVSIVVGEPERLPTGAADLAVALQNLITVCFGAFLLMRGWRNRTALLLATFLLTVFGRPPNLWAPHPVTVLLTFLLENASLTVCYTWVVFCLDVSGGPSDRRQDLIVRGAGLALWVGALYAEAGYLLLLPVPGYGPALLSAAIVLLNVVGFTILAVNYRRNDAPARNRIKIVAIAFGCFLVGRMMGSAAGSMLETGESASLLLSVLTGMVVLYFAALAFLAYAVLRRRLFDLGFALNRTLVYGVVSFILLAGFGLGEWSVDHLVPESWRRASELYSAGIALVLFLSFHRLRDAVERQVERLFFHRWQQNEAALRRFVASAGHFHQTPALCRAFAEEATRFCEGAPAALYLRAADGGFRLQAGGLSGAAEAYDEDDHAFALMRAERRAVALATAHGALPGALALPMLDQGALAGFVLVGPKSDDADYRPDEVELLGWAAHQVGLDLQALHARDLEAQVVSLNETVARLSAGKARLTARTRTASSLQPASSAV